MQTESLSEAGDKDRSVGVIGLGYFVVNDYTKIFYMLHQFLCHARAAASACCVS